MRSFICPLAELQAPAPQRERHVRHLVGLVDDLLEVSRISQGKIQLRRGRAELATVVHPAVDTARSLLELS